MKAASKSECYSLFSFNVLLQHDNMWHHIAYATAQQIMSLHLDCLPHPADSHNITPWDYCVLGSPKQVPDGEKFSKRLKRQCIVRVSQKTFFLQEPR